MSKMDVQLVLSQVTQLQGTLMALEARVAALENGDTAGDPQCMGPGWSVPRNIIGGDGGDLVGTPGSGSEVVQGSLRFKSAYKSNVVVKTTEESDESIDGTIEIGVYYV